MFGRQILLTISLFALLGAGAIAECAPQGADIENLIRLSAQADKIYVSPHGSGSRNGASPADALAFPEAKRRLHNPTSSTIVYFAPGIYTLEKTLSIRAPANGILHLKGAPGVSFRGDFDFAAPNENGSGIRLQSGNIIIEDITFSGTRTCIRVDQRFPVNNVYLQDITGRNVHSCIVTYRGSEASVRNWTIKDIVIKGYYQVGIRLAGNKTGDMILRNLTIDGNHGFGPDFCYKGGIQLYAGVSDVVISNARIVNNIGDCKGFQQGEGIEADDRGGTPTNIVVADAYIANSGDANLDLKARGVTLRRIHTQGGSLTHANYKFWTYQDYLCIKCSGGGPVRSHLLLVGAKAIFRVPTFYSNAYTELVDLRCKRGPSKLVLAHSFSKTATDILACADGESR